MKKSISILVLLISITISVFSQITDNPKPKGDYWGTFCLVKETIADTNYFVIDLKEIPTIFERVFFKNYFIEQDVFSSRIVTYKTNEDYAVIAVPSKYKIDDFRQFAATIKKVTHAFNQNYSSEQKQEYINKHQNK